MLKPNKYALWLIRNPRDRLNSTVVAISLQVWAEFDVDWRGAAAVHLVGRVFCAGSRKVLSLHTYRSVDSTLKEEASKSVNCASF